MEKLVAALVFTSLSFQVNSNSPSKVIVESLGEASILINFNRKGFGEPLKIAAPTYHAECYITKIECDKKDGCTVYVAGKLCGIKRSRDFNRRKPLVAPRVKKPFSLRTIH